MITDSFILQPKLKFYQTHEFHKRANNLLENKAFSIFFIQTFALFKQIVTICKILSAT